MPEYGTEADWQADYDRRKASLTAEYEKWRQKLGADPGRQKTAWQDYQKNLALLEQRMSQTHRRKVVMGEQLGELRSAQEEAYERLTRGFRGETETAVGLQLGGVLRGVGQTAARRGIIGSGLASAAEARARTQLSGQALAAQMSFSRQLASLHEQARQGFIQKKFDFFDAMEMLEDKQAFEEDMARLHRSWEKDDRARQNMLGLGTAIGGVLGGPVGAWLSGYLGSNVSYGGSPSSPEAY